MASKIQSFYNDKTAFLTGATGFVGKILLEKLLRTCHVKRIYVLMRAKKDISAADRLEEIFKAPLFKTTLTESNKRKVCAVEGDCEQQNLGINKNDMKFLSEEVNCVFHCAATVRFDEELKKATLINVRGTKEVITLAKNMRYLESFVYCSTAYSNCTESEIKEIFYPPTISSKNLLNLIDILPEENINYLTPNLLGKWPNTYTFTKCVAEEVVLTEGADLPIVVVRPAIVMSTKKEPVIGWCDSFNGPIGIIVAFGLGLLHTANINTNIITELVPADYVVNLLLAAGWKASKNESTGDEKKSKKEIPIYNFVSSPERPLTWGEMISYAYKYIDKCCLSQAVWYNFLLPTSNKHLFRFYAFFFHSIPAHLVDMIISLLGGQSFMIKIYKRIDKLTNVTAYFANREWSFTTNNSQTLWNTLSEQDKSLFEFSISCLNWEEYTHNYLLGGRQYLMNESLDTLPKAKRKQKIFAIAHYSLVAILLYYMFKLIMYTFGALT